MEEKPQVTAPRKPRYTLKPTTVPLPAAPSAGSTADEAGPTRTPSASSTPGAAGEAEPARTLGAASTTNAARAARAAHATRAARAGRAADPFARAENEDDDGYDPYSDRPAEPERTFQRDPWA